MLVRPLASLSVAVTEVGGKKRSVATESADCSSMETVSAGEISKFP